MFKIIPEQFLFEMITPFVASQFESNLKNKIVIFRGMTILLRS